MTDASEANGPDRAGTVAAGWRADVELCWGTVHPTTFVELIEAAGSAGIKAVAATPHLYFDAKAAGLTPARARASLAEHGVGVSVIDPLLRDLPGAPEASAVAPRDTKFFVYTESDCFAMAEELGAGIVNIAHYLGQPVAMAPLIDAIGAVAERARVRGLEVTVEFIPGTGIPDLGTALAIVEGTGGAVSVMFDTWHFNRSGGTLGDLDGLPPAAIGGLQISDVPEGFGTKPYVPMSGRLFPGEGVLPLRAMLRTLLDHRPELNVGVEVFGAAVDQLSGAEAARRARSSIEAILSAPG